jgi:hypothetical protein
MPNWKRVIVSGSDASLNTLTVINGITGSLHGTASYASNALSASFATTSSFATTASYAISASHAPDTVEIMYFNTNAAALSDTTTYTFTVNTSLTTNINQTPGMTLPIGTIVGWRLTTYNASTIGSSETGTLKLFYDTGPSEVTLSSAITWDGNRTAIFNGSASEVISSVVPSWASITTPTFATNPGAVKMILILQMEI